MKINMLQVLKANGYSHYVYKPLQILISERGYCLSNRNFLLIRVTAYESYVVVPGNEFRFFLTTIMEHNSTLKLMQYLRNTAQRIKRN